MSNDLKTIDVVSVHSSNPITVNSGSNSTHNPVFVRYLYKNEPQQTNGNYDAITLSSERSLRCPVSWGPRHKSTNMFLPSHIQTYTPSPQSKVNSWFGRLQEHKSNILVRHDFTKDFTISKCNTTTTNTVSQQDNLSSNSVYNKHNVFNISIGESMQNENKVKKYEIETTMDSGAKISKPFSSINYKCNKEFHNIFVNNGEIKEKAKKVDKNNGTSHQMKRKFSTNDDMMPLSPESQKKKELYSYLQLMNMDATTKKDRVTVQNRRSTRVKNYILMTEKKELERKLNSEAQQNGEKRVPEPDQQSKRSSPTSSTCSTVDFTVESSNLSGKSFKELQMNIVKKFLWQQPGKKLQAIENTTDSSSTTCVVSLSKAFPREFIEKQENFEDTIEKFFAKEGMRLKTNNRKSRELFKKQNKSKLVKRGRPRKYERDKLKNKENMIAKRKYKTKKLISQFGKVLKNQQKKNKFKSILKMNQKSPTGQNRNMIKRKELISRKNNIRPLFRSIRNRSLRSTGILQHVGIKTLLNNNHKKYRPLQRKKESRRKSEESKKEQIDNEEQQKGLKITNEPEKEEALVKDEVKDEENQNVMQRILIDHNYITVDNDTHCNSPFLVDESSSNVDSNLTDLKIDPQNLEPTINSENNQLALTEESTLLNETVHNNILNSPCLGFQCPTAINNPLAKIDTMITVLHNNLAESQGKAPEAAEEDIKNSPKMVKNEIVDSACISPRNCAYIALNTQVKAKSLHRNLIPSRSLKKRLNFNSENDTEETEDWEIYSTPPIKNQKNEKRNSQSHSIKISDENGAILKAYYIDFSLIIAQEFMVSFWSQSALGNVLGAQNMWIPKGQINRLVLDNGCAHKSSSEMVLSLDNSVAYVELWTKEHKSDKRERPVADVFATVYFCKQRQNGVFKKVLQLENING